ncbi:MAG: hypothetical protein GXO42_00080 [bacterium]|nr:hypothetical protein [bacterium]
MRFQGALEYLIILGAAVLIAGIVVAYMFGFLKSGAKQNMINKCVDFKNKLCVYATQFEDFAAQNPAEAMAEYLQGVLHYYDGSKFENVSCSISSSSSSSSSGSTVTCKAGNGNIQFTYYSKNNTITVSQGSIYVSTRLKIYFISNNGQPSSSNDYLCVKSGGTIYCS